MQRRSATKSKPWNVPMFYQTRLTKDIMDGEVQETRMKIKQLHCDWSRILGDMPPNKRHRAKQTIEDHYFDMFKKYCHSHPVICGPNNAISFKPVSYHEAVLRPVDKILSDKSLTLQTKLDYMMDMGFELFDFAALLNTLLTDSEDDSSVHIDIEK